MDGISIDRGTLLSDIERSDLEEGLRQERNSLHDNRPDENWRPLGWLENFGVWGYGIDRGPIDPILPVNPARCKAALMRQ